MRKTKNGGLVVLLTTSFFCETIDQIIFIPTNLSSYLSLTNKNSSMRTNTTYISNKVTRLFDEDSSVSTRDGYRVSGGGGDGGGKAI